MICLKNKNLYPLGTGLCLILCIFNSATFAQATEKNNCEKRIVCYWGSWSVYRPGDGKFDVTNVDPSLCTHIIYSFTGVDGNTHEMKLLDPYNDLSENWGKGSMDKLIAYKANYPNLKVLIACGGWNEGTKRFTAMASTAENRAKFISSVCQFLQKYGLDGLDMDWEYPVAEGAELGKPEDYENFICLLKEMRDAFNSMETSYLLTAAVAAGKGKIDLAYNVPEMAKYLDFINVMAYDFHGDWEKFAHCHSPLYAFSQDVGDNAVLNSNFSINYYLAKGVVDPCQLVLGVPAYGKGFTLQDAANSSLYAPVIGGSKAGPYTRQAGTLGYNEICIDKAWNFTYDDEMKTMYGVKGDQWVSYDNVDTVRTKCDYVKEHGLGGIMVWSIETDDFHGNCTNGKFPLLKAINQGLNRTPADPVIPNTPAPTSTTTQSTTTTGQPGNSSDVTAPVNPSTTTSTTPPSVEDFECPSAGLYPHRECCKYNHCDGQKVNYVTNCAGGLHYSSTAKVCDWPKNANCSTRINETCPLRDS